MVYSAWEGVSISFWRASSKAVEAARGRRRLRRGANWVPLPSSMILEASAWDIAAL